ncbi:MAG TPA: hypothetical protein VHF24_09715 [Acidimicrobiales bacterium]|nr:hypothetical protein [Acidimicrobiales bacterium]
MTEHAERGGREVPLAGPPQGPDAPCGEPSAGRQPPTLTDEWVVLVEAELEEGAGVIEIDQLKRLLLLLCEHGATGLWSLDRYAVQLVVPATSPEAALVTALSRWRDAVGRLELPEWRLVRAEIKSPAELEAEHRSAVQSVGVVPARTPTSADALRAAYLATRRLLACRSRAEAAGVVVDLVRQLGADVIDAADHPCALPFDLSFGDGEPRFPAADLISVARLHLEEVLPSVLLDAARVMRLVEVPLLVEP